MDLDDLLPRRKADDTLTALARQDLDPLSVTELEERIKLLEAEIVRVKDKLQKAAQHRNAADQLFKK